MKILISIILISCFSMTSFADEPIKTLWTSFYSAAKEWKFDEPVKIYEIDAECKIMCFIYKKQVWFFQDGKVRKAVHAKMFNVDGINRISYEQGKDGGAFILWSNEEIILSFGS